MEDVYGPRPSGTGVDDQLLAASDTLLVFPASPSVWQLSSPVRHDAEVAGEAVGLDTGGVRGRPQELTFMGAEGQWVQLADADDDEDRWLGSEHRALLGPDGRRVRAAVPGLWRLPADGEPG